MHLRSKVTNLNDCVYLEGEKQRQRQTKKEAEIGRDRNAEGGGRERQKWELTFPLFFNFSLFPPHFWHVSCLFSGVPPKPRICDLSLHSFIFPSHFVIFPLYFQYISYIFFYFSFIFPTYFLHISLYFFIVISNVSCLFSAVPHPRPPLESPEFFQVLGPMPLR